MTHPCTHNYPLVNVRYWAALGASIGECNCGSTVVVKAVKPKVTTTFLNSKSYLDRLLDFLWRALTRAGVETW